MDDKTRQFRRPLNHLYKREWYLDHEKRLQDALITQFGVDEPGYHADGLHRQQSDPFGED